MKQYTRDPASTFVILMVTGVLLSACGGGGGGPSGDSGSKPLLEQQPTTATTASSAPDAAPSASAVQAATSASAAGAAPTAPILQPASSAAGDAGTTSSGTPQQSGGNSGAGSNSTTNTAGSPPAATPGATSNAGANQSSGNQVTDAPNAQVTAGTEAPPAGTTGVATSANCVINETRYFGGSCWANVKDTIPSGVNRSFGNARLNHTGSVNANCIAGKVNWSTGLCKSAAAAPAEATTSSTPRPANNAYKIGTFYFPGWRDNQAGAPAKYPWARIKSYPEREPMLGWYDDGSVAVVEQQLKWMRTYGIDYVVFDWYWNGKATELNHTVNAYLKTEARKDIPFALLWSNHTSIPRTKLEFTNMVDYWIDHYFERPEIMKIDGKPVIFIFSHLKFVKQAEQIGQTFTSLLAEAESRAREAGHKGIYFVAGTHVDSSILKVGAKSGYSAFSAYNYHGRDDDSSTSYEELDSAYQHVWNAVLKDSSIPYIMPMSQGWDNRPWGGSSNPLHDMSGGVLPEFERHLTEARRLMDANPAKTMKMGVICCWNEFGEGAFIEPTKRDGFSYLEKVQKIFGAP